MDAADPAHGICACDRMAREAALAEPGVIQVDVQRLHQHVGRGVPDLHVEGGERHVAGVLHGEHQPGIVPGADAGIGEHRRRHVGGGDRTVGEPGERPPRIGARAVLQVLREVAGAAAHQLGAVDVLRMPHCLNVFILTVLTNALVDINLRLRQLHQSERAAGRIGVRIVAHAADQTTRAGGVRRSGFRPVEADAAVIQADEIKVRCAGFDAVIGDRSAGRDAPQAMGIAARLRRHALQIEQPARARQLPEADDIPLRQHLPAGLRHAGKLAVRIQRIERDILRRRGVPRQGVAGDLRVIRYGQFRLPHPSFIAEVQGLTGIAQNLDLLRIAGGGPGAGDGNIPVLYAEPHLRHDGIVVRAKGLSFTITHHFQPAGRAALADSLHDHGRHGGLRGHFRR